jgi:hypothetical protein
MSASQQEDRIVSVTKPSDRAWWKSATVYQSGYLEDDDMRFADHPSLSSEPLIDTHSYSRRSSAF